MLLEYLNVNVMFMKFVELMVIALDNTSTISNRPQNTSTTRTIIRIY
jgi:hypothetical protein